MNLPDIYFTPEWGRLYQEFDKGEACIFDFKNALGHIYYQFIKREAPVALNKKKYYDVITPYGFSGPFILECDAINKELLISRFEEAFNEYCLNEHIVAEYIRFSPWLKNHKDFSKIYSLKYNNYTLFIDLTNPNFFMEEFCHKVRAKIHRAEKYGIQLEYDHDGSSIKIFHQLYQNTIKKNDIPEYYNFNLDFLIRTFKTLQNRQFIINARFENEYISSGIFIDYGDYLHFHLVANEYSHSSMNANSLIMYEAANWGLKNGKKQMHIGGAFTEQLFAFKKQFTKNGFCDFFIGKRIRNDEVYKALVDLRLKSREINDPSYFPLYRG